MRKYLCGLMALGTAAGMLLVAGCGGGDDNDDPGTSVITNIVNNTTTVVTNAPPVTNTVAVALAVPGQVSPANGSSFSHFPRTVVFVWAPVAGADKYVLDWEIQNPVTLVWSTNWSVSDVVGTTKTISFTGAQPGRWRVRAKKNDGTEGPWSGWSSFVFTT